MANELEDWQLALLVEARSYQNPSIVEQEEAEALRDAQKYLDQADGLESPVVVERDVKKSYEENEALREAAAGIDNWEVVDADQREQELEALSDVEDLLSDALKEQCGLRDSVVESMGASAMVDQFRDEDEGTIELESLAQQPETGGSPESETAEANEDTSDEDPIEALSASERNEVREKLDRADMMEDRTPNYAESLREEAAQIAGVEDADEIKTEAL